MKKIIIIEESENTVLLNNVLDNEPIFAKREGKFVGMLVNEVDSNTKSRWILRIGGCYGSSGYHGSRCRLIKDSMKDGYEFYVENV